MKQEPTVISYCYYCKRAIYKGESYTVDEEVDFEPGEIGIPSEYVPECSQKMGRSLTRRFLIDTR